MVHSVPAVELAEIVPQLQDFATTGHLDRSIADGVHHLAELYGQERLFCGPARAQASTRASSCSKRVTMSYLTSMRRGSRWKNACATRRRFAHGSLLTAATCLRR